MSRPHRNCELTRKNIRTVRQYEVDYAEGWNLYERQSYSDLCQSKPLSGLRNNDDSTTTIRDVMVRYNKG